MSFVTAAVAVVAGASVYTAVESRNARKDAQKAAEQQNAIQEQAMADEKARRAKKDARAPDKANYYTAATAGGNSSGLSSGLGGTLLTGSQGVITDPANISKKTLLGQ